MLTDAAPETETKTIDEEIASDWASIREKYATEEPETPKEPVKAEEPVEPKPVAEKPSAKPEERARDDTGKFVKADAKVPKAPAAVDTGKPADAVAADQGAQPANRDINRAPSTWKPAARAEWEKLTPSIKAEIHRREADFQNGQAQLLPDAKLGANMRQVIDPYRLLIEADGGTPERAVADLLRTAAQLRMGSPQQKIEALANTARTFGIDLRAFGQAILGQPAQQQPPQQFHDPRVDQLLAHQRQQEIQRQQRETADTENVVTRWMNETDTEGNPKRQYLADVINEMSALVPQLRQADPTLTHAQALDAAYERAIWAHPEIRPLLQAQQQTVLEEQRRAENQQRVRDARRAASVNVPRRASTPSPGKPGKLEDTIASTARELGLIA